MSRSVMLPAWMHNDYKALNHQAVIGWLHDYRHKHWQALNDAGLPTRQHERFKYIDTHFLFENSYQVITENKQSCRELVRKYRLSQEESILLLSIDGYFQAEASEVYRLPEGTIVCSLKEAMQQYPDKIKQHLIDANDVASKSPLASLNAAMLQQGIFIDIPGNVTINIPIHLMSLISEQENHVQHNMSIIHVGGTSQVSIFEETIALADNEYMETRNVVLMLQANALVDYYKMTRGNKKSRHFSHRQIVQEKDSKLTWTNFSEQCHFSRDETTVLLHEPGAECYAGGLYSVNQKGQQIDNHIDIHHLAPYTKSEMLYKGLISDKAKAIFNGRLLVNKDAIKVTANQENHHLLLADSAEAYAKPELEIYADDVKCKHGATSGQLDQAAVFYLCSRGISQDDAKRLLVRGFAQAIYQRVNPLVIKKHLVNLSENYS